MDGSHCIIKSYILHRFLFLHVCISYLLVVSQQLGFRRYCAVGVGYTSDSIVDLEERLCGATPRCLPWILFCGPL